MINTRLDWIVKMVVMVDGGEVVEGSYEAVSANVVGLVEVVVDREGG